MNESFGDRLARRITDSMATWTFIFAFLGFCFAEIIFNHITGTARFHFDPETLILNLGLSLIAAIQGSVIMIAQKILDRLTRAILEEIRNLVMHMVTASGERAKMQRHIEELTEKIVALEEAAAADAHRREELQLRMLTFLERWEDDGK